MIVDVQKAIDDPIWARLGPRNNPTAENNMAALLAAWRRTAWPIFHIRHDSTFATSPYRPGQPGHDFKDQVMPHPGETVIPKQTNSAFIGTDLEVRLRNARIKTVAIAGVITNNSVEATVRMSGNLGFDTFLIEDATFTFAQRDYNKRLWPAEHVHALSLANLDGEYCTVVKTAAILQSLL